MIIYLSILFLLLFCILEYDIRGVKKYQDYFINLILLVLIIVSGFSYRLGGDGMTYLNEWKYYGDISDLSYSYLTGFQGRMPGWVLLSTLCKTITSEYWFFKIIHAIILNIAYVYTIKRNAKYVFTGLLFYFVLIYFNQNFQLLRESMAISFFFFGLPFYYSGKWFKYYLFILLAISFHEGAAILIFLPIVKLLGINKYSVLFYLVLGVIMILSASYILSYLTTIQIDGELQGKIFHYTSKMETDYVFTTFSNTILNVLIPLLILIYYKRKSVTINYLFPAIFGILLYVTSLVIPIAYRLSNYFLIFSYLIITDFVSGMFLRRQRSILLLVIILSSFLLFKSRMYLLPYGESGIPSYVQYYPYASIFDKDIDQERERLYRSN